MNKNLYLIVFLGFLAISFYPYHKSNFVISANKKIFNDTVKQLTKEDIMGKYILKAGYFFCELNLYKDTFNSVSGACTYEIQESGKWDFQNNTLYFSGICSNGEDCTYSYFSNTEKQEEYTVIRQDSFLILINKKQSNDAFTEVYKEICSLHNAGSNATQSTFLHKKLENYTPVPIPTIPTEYHKFFLKKLIICKVTTTKNDTLLTINAGKQDGVFEGLKLYKKVELKQQKKLKTQKREVDEKKYTPLFLTFEVVNCGTNTATLKPVADLTFYLLLAGNIKKLKVGDTLHSKKQ